LPTRTKGETLFDVFPRSRAFIAIVSAVILSSHAPAFAAPPKAAPKPPPAAKAAPPTKAYDDAVALFRAGNYEAALAAFNKLSNIEARRGAAFALEKLGRNEEAIAEFQKFIAGAPASLDDQVKAARTRIAELAATRPGKVRVITSPSGATIEVVGHAPFGKTTPADIELPAGKYIVRATLAGTLPAEREVDIAAGSSQEVSLELVPSKSAGSPSPSSGAAAATAGPAMNPTPPPTLAPRPGIERYGAPIVTGAVGALSLAAGVYFGLSALDKGSKYDSRPTQERRADAETTAAFSTTALTAAVILGVVTVVLLVTSPSADGGGKPAAAAVRQDGLRIRF
jgi:tetratricopeptide (TPR) repeat protein